MASQLLRRGRLREQVQTDQSLQTERRNTDRELHKRAARTGGEAEKVVRTARDRAAARREYAAAAARTGRDRATRSRALAKLFLAERQLTDGRLRAERARSQQLISARGELLAQVSHDLSSFLGAIALRLEVLQHCISSGRELPGDSIQAIQEVAAAMRRLIGDLVDAASMESGTFRIEKDDSRLAEILTLSADAFREAAAGRRISLTVSTEECQPVRFDHQRILQVMANLVGNALKFTPAGGRIAIRLQGANGGCQVSVADSGSGVRKEKLESIFDRFTQERRTNGRGLGLGLFIVRSIVEAHGGKVWAESRPGRGSTFYFTLPATESRRRGGGRRNSRRKHQAT